MMRKIPMPILFVFTLILFGGCPLPPKNSVSTETSVSPADANAAEPAIAVDAQEGNLYVLCVEHGAEKKADVYLQKFGGDMQPIGGRVRINSQAGQAATRVR